MSEKRLDRCGRWRNVIVAFRVSKEEGEAIDEAVALSGHSKQDYDADNTYILTLDENIPEDQRAEVTVGAAISISTKVKKASENEKAEGSESESESETEPRKNLHQCWFK